jgi:hypothetical protein
MFKLSDKKIIGYGSDIFYSLDILRSHPSVRELSSYYSANRIYLNSWLKNEAIKRGLIE